MTALQKTETPLAGGARLRQQATDDIAIVSSEPQVRSGKVTVWRRPRQFYECRGAR